MKRLQIICERSTAHMHHLGESSMYGFGAFIVIYLVGITIYEIYQFTKKLINKHKNEEFTEEE